MIDEMPSQDPVSPESVQKVGKQRASADAHVLRVWMRGTFDEQDAREFYDRLAQLRAEHGVVHCVADMSESGIPTPEARRHILERFRAGAQVDGFVFVQANLAVRTMIVLITNAVRLTRGSFESPMVFVSSQAEAEDWLRRHPPRPPSPDAKKPAGSASSS
jgi:hypothetical protein